MMLDYMDENPFGHLCISGPAGSGKMSLLTLANELYTERHKVKANIIVVTLESSFDSKNLVGTYVCNETGDFTFKKGPLTVAAEQGMWLVLRNIEETPSDLLSFLLPLIQENTLHVTSNMVIQPRLGFRLCFI
jgi:midasin (ATPase involved in ribosome maturation)